MVKRKKRYDAEFKRSAVELLLLGEKKHTDLAKDLGVASSTLSDWRDAYLARGGSAQVEGEEKSATELAQEIRHLRKELETVKRQREILKKAMSIVSEQPAKGIL